MAKGDRESVLRIEVSLQELVKALQAMDEEDRECFLENLLAASSPEYLKSIREARGDYQQGRTIRAEELFKCQFTR